MKKKCKVLDISCTTRLLIVFLASLMHLVSVVFVLAVTIDLFLGIPFINPNFEDFSISTCKDNHGCAVNIDHLCILVS